MVSINKYTLMLLLVAVTACHSLAKPDLIDQIIFRNESAGALQNVTLKVPQTGMTMSCSLIPVSGECSVGLPEREDRKNNVVFLWTQNGKKYQKDLRSTVSLYDHDAKRLKAVVRIKNNGEIETQVVRHEE